MFLYRSPQKPYNLPEALMQFMNVSIWLSHLDSSA